MKEQEDGQEDDGEGIDARGAAVPELPSREEVERHMLTHAPYRSWCRHCVKGKAKGKPHMRSTGVEDEVPCVVVDYMYMNSEAKEDDAQSMPILVYKDLVTSRGGTGMMFAKVVPQKGRCEYATKSVVTDVEALGQKNMVLKSDGEPALVALKETIKEELEARVVLEESPVGESKSNGAVENAVQQVQGQVRSMKDALECRLGIRLTEESPMIPWMVMHAAKTMNRYLVGPDGKTAHRRWKGKDFKRDVAEFGETVLYLKAKSKGVDKLDSRWEPAVWLGVIDSTGEVLVGTEIGVVRARDIKRYADAKDRWDNDQVAKVKGTPWQPVPGKDGDRVPIRVRLAEDPEPPRPPEEGKRTEPVRRRVRITKEDIKKYGYTINCPGCKAINRGGVGQGRR